MLYQIEYSDRSIFLGGDLEDSKWNEITKPIAKLIYTFQEQTIVLKNYESYNHLFIKKNRILSGNQSIFGILLFAKRNNIIDCFSFDRKQKKLNHYISEYTKKFQSPFMTGWKIGLSSNNPTFAIL